MKQNANRKIKLKVKTIILNNTFYVLVAINYTLNNFAIYFKTFIKNNYNHISKNKITIS